MTVTDTNNLSEGCPVEGSLTGGAAAAHEARRMARLARLERLSDRAERISEKLCDLIEDTLPEDQRAPFARIADPVLAFTRTATTIRRITALEEQIDESAEQRAARLAEEAAKRAKEAAEPDRLPVDRRIHLRASRRIAREAVRDAIRARDGAMDGFRREALLDDLTSDLDDPDYADDMDLILAQIGKELDAILGPPDVDDDTDEVLPQAGKPVQTRDYQVSDLQAAIQGVNDAIARARARGASG